MSPQQAVDSWTDRKGSQKDSNFVDPLLVHPQSDRPTKVGEGVS